MNEHLAEGLARSIPHAKLMNFEARLATLTDEWEAFKNTLIFAPPEEEAVSIQLYFDGGLKANRHAYGSFCWNQQMIPVRVRHADASTSVQAEYATLLKALEHVESYVDPAICDLEVFGDAQVIIRQIEGTTAVRHPKLAHMVDRVTEKLRRFRSFKMNWVPREEMVDRLGH